MQYLTFDLSDAGDDIAILEAMASTRAEHHAAVLAEAQQLLAWAWHHHPHSHGPLDDGGEWDHDLQVHREDDRWHTVTLTLTARPHVAQALLAAFDPPEG